jgi:MFS family permease
MPRGDATVRAVLDSATPTRRAFPAAVVVFRATADVMLLTALAVYVGRRGSPFAVSMVTAAYFLGLMLFSPVWGALADVSRRRYAVLLGTTAFATLAVLPLVGVGGVWPLIAVFFVYTVFAAGYSPLILAIASERSSGETRGQSVGVINSARAGGGTIGRVLAGVLVGLLAPGVFYLVLAGISLLGTVAAVFVDDPASDRTGTLDVSTVVGEVRSRLVPDVGADVFRQAGLRWLYLAVVVQGVAVGGVLSLMPVYLTQEVGASERTMGLLLGLSPALQTLLMYPFGRLADRIGRKPLIALGTTGRGVVFPFLAAAVTAPGTLELRLVVAGGSFLVLASSFSAMFSSTTAFIGDVTPDERSSEFMGLLWTTLSVGGVIGPLLLGTIATLASYELSFAAGGTLALGATVAVVFGVGTGHEGP